MAVLAAEEKPVLLSRQISCKGRAPACTSAICVEPSLDALSTSTTRSGGGWRRFTAARQAGSVVPWLYVTTTTEYAGISVMKP